MGVTNANHSSSDDQDIVFQSFEASPPADQVLAATKALRWGFPSRSAKMPLAALLKPDFLESLAHFLQQASVEPIHSMQARALNNGVDVVEVRDTTNPALVTEILLSIVEAKGEGYHAVKLHKRVRDDVVFSEKKLPW
jgi:hypothetical protein